MRGEDPDDFDVMLRGAADDLSSAMAMLERMAEEAGIDPNEPLERPPPSLAARRLRREAEGYAEVVFEVAEVAVRAGDPALADHLSGRGWLIVVKSARLESQTQLHDWNDKEAWEPDGAPTVMLVEHVLAEVDVVVTKAGLASRQHSEAREAFLRALEPFAQQVSDAARAELSRLIAEGRAPSPFSTTSCV